MPLPEDALLSAVATGKGLFCIHDAAFPLSPNRQIIEALGIRPAFDSIRPGAEGEFVFQDVMLARADPEDPSQRFVIRFAPEVRRHPILDGIAEFELADEIWAQNLAPGVQLLLNAEVGDRVPCHPRFRQPAPICGCRQIGNGRLAFFSLGHYAPTYSQPSVIRLFANAVEWLSGRTNDNEFNFDLFLSFASADEVEAQALLEAGSRLDLSIFMAKRSLEPGDLWDSKIRTALQTSREVAILVTNSSMRSEWVAIEWGGAWALQKRVTPILLRCDVGLLPEHLKRHQAIDFSQIERFLKIVRERKTADGVRQ